MPFGAVSKLHRITSAECWHFYLGLPLTVTELAADGAVTHTQLGTDFGAGQTPQARRRRWRTRPHSCAVLRLPMWAR